MSQKHSAIEDPLKKSKWITREGEVTNWPKFAKDRGWISQAPPQYGPKAKKYLTTVMHDLGDFPTAKAFYTDDLPLKGGDSPKRAVLIDKVGSGHCFVRNVRIEGGQVFVTSPLWPHAEVPFPLDYFKSIERVFVISYQ